MALPCVETEKTMYCPLGKRQETALRRQIQRNPLKEQGMLPYTATATDHGKTRRIGVNRDIGLTVAAFCSILALNRSCRRLWQSQLGIPKR